jgi:hypothetical protein
MLARRLWCGVARELLMRTNALLCFGTSLLLGCSLLVNPRGDNEYDLRDSGTVAPDAQTPRDGGVDAGSVIPGAPNLRFPWNGYTTGSVHTGGLPAERNALRPRFLWEPVDGAETYEIELSSACEAQTRDTCSFDGAVEGTASTTEWRPDASLAVSMTAPVGRRYVWRVRACNVAGCSEWSQVRYVDVGRQPSDYNGDGYADLLVSAPGEGRVYQAHGPDFGDVTAIGEVFIDGSRIPPARFSPTVLATVGDVNGDGFGDAVVGFPAVDQDASNTQAGVVQLCSGGRSMTCEVAGRFSSASVYSGRYGWAIAGAGDLDGDGYADAVIGAPGEWDGDFAGGVRFVGKVHVFGGTSTGLSERLVLESPAPEASGGFGSALVVSGDVNGDGFVDLAVAAPGEAGGGTGGAGRVYLWSGGPSGIGGEPFARPVSPAPAVDAEFGTSLAVTDLQGDGFADVLVGAPRDGGGAGRIYRVDGGRAGGSAREVTLPTELDAQLASGWLMSAGRSLEIARGALTLVTIDPTMTTATAMVLQVMESGPAEYRGGWAIPVAAGNLVAFLGDVSGTGTEGLGSFSLGVAGGPTNAGAVELRALSGSGVTAPTEVSSPTPVMSGGFGASLADTSSHALTL